MTLLEQMLEIRKTEPWQALNDDETLKVHYVELIKAGRLIPYEVDGELIGYVEFTRLNFAQLGYLMVTGEAPYELFDRQGAITFITNLHLKDNCSDSVNLIRHFKRTILEKYPKVSYIVGQHQGKRLKPYAVHKLRES